MKVKFDVTLFDPVPGMFSRHGIREEINLNSKDYYDADGRRIGSEKTPKAKYRSLAGQQESTVFYSLHCGHNSAYNPQKVKGAKRIIISPEDHIGVAFKGTEFQKWGGSVKHRKAYVDPNTMAAYRGSGINELPDGLYFADENNTLVKVKDYAEYLSIRSSLIEGNESVEAERIAILDEVARDFFEKEEAKASMENA